MTDKELKKLRRQELLELMLYVRRELDSVKQENEKLRSQLETQTAAQGDVNKEILQIVNSTSKQVEQICKFHGINAEEIAVEDNEKAEH